jgi:hypothetical protein
MHPFRTLLLHFFFLTGTIGVFANVGGVTPRPGLIGDPIVWELTNISVAKEELFLQFFERDGQKICTFTALYYLQSDTNLTVPVSGIFYGLRTAQTQVFFNEMPALSAIDSSNFNKIDSLIFSAARHNDSDAVWYDWRRLQKQAFSFVFQPGQSNILKVTGEITLEPTHYWYYAAGAPTYTKHPLWNKEISKGDEIFQYLITPIETWKAVGTIEVHAEYPAHWKTDFRSNTAKTSQTTVENQRVKQVLVFKDSLPTAFSMYFIKKQKHLFVGGGTLGLRGLGKGTFGTRVGWEFGWHHSNFVNTLLAVDYETDYRHYHQFCVTALPSSAWFGLWPGVGAGIGVQVRIVERRAYTGVRLRMDLSWGLFNLNFNWDFFPKLGIEGQYVRYWGFSF